jgi:hypothetical protein
VTEIPLRLYPFDPTWRCAGVKSSHLCSKHGCGASPGVSQDSLSNPSSSRHWCCRRVI